MTYTEQAIQKAIEGGWESPPVMSTAEKMIEQFAFMNPLFWQALGRAAGWEEDKPRRKFNTEMGVISEKIIYHGYMARWHRFIDHCNEGKDAEGFFEQLLK